MSSSSSFGTAAAGHIPDEIIFHKIFLRLPVKYMLIFRCVCKDWLNFIDSDSFVKMQVVHATRTADPAAVVDCPRDHKLQIYSYKSVLDMDDDENNRTCSGPLNSPSRVTCPFSPKWLIDILDSRNGLLLCHQCAEYELSKGKGTLYLWNPSTRVFVVLPHDTPLECPGGGNFEKFAASMKYGFIYDSANDDYKVLKMVYFLKYTLHMGKGVEYFMPISEVRVYSLRSNSWRKFQTDALFLPSSIFAPQAVRTFSNGALHWIMDVAESPEPKIISFNVEKVEYREIQKSSTIDMDLADSNFRPLLQVLRGSLCIFRTNIAQHYVEVWSMKEYGLKDSWTKLFTITAPMSECKRMFPWYHIPNLQPLKCCDNGEILIMLKARALMIYDPRKDSTRFVYGSIKDMDLFALTTHIETLENPLRVRQDGLGRIQSSTLS